jgi:uncharacterized protein YbcV (DUF1398 family)
MFTINQIKAAHAKVRSGADFPSYIQELKGLGITSYEHFLSDGHIVYYGSNDCSLMGDAKWSPTKITDQADSSKLKAALAIHQQGATDYPTFCRQAAAAGVEKWIVDLGKMLCVYFDIKGNELIVETISTP